MPRRVVITGIGAVSPNGIGTEAFWCATRKGVSGVGPITRFDTTGLAVRVAGEVKNFCEEDYVTPKDRQHTSRATPLAIAAVTEALQWAGLDTAAMSRQELRGIGVMVGSGGGSVEFTEEQYRLYHSGNWRQCSVYVVPTSTMGTLASEISMKFGLRGLSHVFTTGCTSSTDALGRARHHRGRRRGRAHRSADPAGVHGHADHVAGLERPARARFTPVFARPRRIRHR
jgi:3-oxoacyl-[acyl-carrier-protein] synthase II